MKQIIEDLQWRYSAKKYNPTKKLKPEDIAIIRQSLRLTPTSYGLQALKFLFIETAELREALKKHAWNQTQVTDASHLLVICSRINIDEAYIDQHMQNVATIRNMDIAQLQGYGNHVKTKLGEKGTQKTNEWSARQAYIALGQLLHTCAQLRIDATPMEGFEADEVNELLDLEKDNWQAVLLVPMGYRSDEDPVQHMAKVRRKEEELFENR